MSDKNEKLEKMLNDFRKITGGDAPPGVDNFELVSHEPAPTEPRRMAFEAWWNTVPCDHVSEHALKEEGAWMAWQHLTSTISVKSEWRCGELLMAAIHDVTSVQYNEDNTITVVIPNEFDADKFNKRLLELNSTLLERCAAGEAREGILKDTVRLNKDWIDEVASPCEGLADTTACNDIQEANEAAINMPADNTALSIVLANKYAEWAKKHDFIGSIRQFNVLAGNTTTGFNIRQSALYLGLQLEELAEKLAHLSPDGDALVPHFAVKLQDWGRYFKSGNGDRHFKDVELAKLLDDDCDQIVVTIGSMLSQGADIFGALNEVCRSNMSKVHPDGTLHKDANGKITKPESYSPPNLEPFVATANAA